MRIRLFACIAFVIGLALILSFTSLSFWNSKFIKAGKKGQLEYIPDEKGNMIPDFSRVGYYGVYR